MVDKVLNAKNNQKVGCDRSNAVQQGALFSSLKMKCQSVFFLLSAAARFRKPVFHVPSIITKLKGSSVVAKLIKIDTIAQECHGKKVWDFSQQLNIVRKNLQGKAKNGICDTLVKHWVISSIVGGSDSLKEQLGDKKELKLEKLNELIAEQNEDVEKGAMFRREMLLKKNGINRNDELSSVCISWPIRASDSIRTDIAKNLNCILSGYAMIDIFMSETEHHVLGVQFHSNALLIVGEERPAVSFFDPNYGEYSFNKREDFFLFFEKFYQQAYLNPGYLFNKGFVVDAFQSDAAELTKLRNY